MILIGVYVTPNVLVQPAAKRQVVRRENAWLEAGPNAMIGVLYISRNSKAVEFDRYSVYHYYTEPSTMSNPISMFCQWEQKIPNSLFLRQPLPGRVLDYTFAEAGLEIRKIAAALRRMNFGEGSGIAILSKNCAHWVMADMAIWMAGYVSVPLYPTLTAPAINQILLHSGVKAIFVGKLDQYDSQRDGIPSDVQKISIPVYGTYDGTNWDDLVANNEPIKDIALRDDNALATVKYTSGTTGMPKGVMISFAAFDYALSHAAAEFGFKKERYFSYLPLSHIAERMLVELGALYTGSTIYFSESLEKFPQNLRDTEPTIFLAVPRIWAKFREKILEKMPQEKLSRLLSYPIVGGIVKRAIRKKLGLAKARWMLTGASPMPKELLEWYSKLGIIIHEVYGMTENLAYSHINLHEVKFGTVGKPWTNIETRIGENGEIQTRHKATMMGYYKEPAQTAEMFTADGFLRTGDQGAIDADGFTTITGRLKDSFKTDKGKYVVPVPIETMLAASTDFEHVCVVGMGVPQPICLVVLNELGKHKSKEELTKSITALLDEVNLSLQSYEKLHCAVIMKGEWSIDNGLITPSLKIRRNEVEKIHLPMYPTWYARQQRVVWE